MRIALIGATGFVESAILHEALDCGHEPTAIAHHPNKREFYVRQDQFKGRTAHTKCGLYLHLLASSLAAALACGTARLGASGLGG